MERILHRAGLISPPRSKTKNSTTSSNEETSFSTPTRARSNSSQSSPVEHSAERRVTASSQSSPVEHSADRRATASQRNEINPFFTDDDYEINAQVIARRSQCQRRSEQHLFLDAFALTKIKE